MISSTAVEKSPRTGGTMETDSLPKSERPIKPRDLNHINSQIKRLMNARKCNHARGVSEELLIEVQGDDRLKYHALAKMLAVYFAHPNPYGTFFDGLIHFCRSEDVQTMGCLEVSVSERPADQRRLRTLCATLEMLKCLPETTWPKADVSAWSILARESHRNANIDTLLDAEDVALHDATRRLRGVGIDPSSHGCIPLNAGELVATHLAAICSENAELAMIGLLSFKDQAAHLLLKDHPRFHARVQSLAFGIAEIGYRCPEMRESIYRASESLILDPDPKGATIAGVIFFELYAKCPSEFSKIVSICESGILASNNASESAGFAKALAEFGTRDYRLAIGVSRAFKRILERSLTEKSIGVMEGISAMSLAHGRKEGARRIKYAEFISTGLQVALAGALEAVNNPLRGSTQQASAIFGTFLKTLNGLSIEAVESGVLAPLCEVAAQATPAQKAELDDRLERRRRSFSNLELHKLLEGFDRVAAGASYSTLARIHALEYLRDIYQRANQTNSKSLGFTHLAMLLSEFSHLKDDSEEMQRFLRISSEVGFYLCQPA